MFIFKTLKETLKQSQTWTFNAIIFISNYLRVIGQPVVPSPPDALACISCEQGHSPM